MWAVLYSILPIWRLHLTTVRPETVVRWHRRGWRLFWRAESRARRVGRPDAELEVRNLIRRLSLDNSLSGAPRIHGEVLKLGYDVAEATVARCLVKRPRSPSPSWPTFLRNHLTEIVAIDFFTVPTVQAFPFDTAPRFLVRDRDSIYGEEVVETLRLLGVERPDSTILVGTIPAH